ncbi:hypothetical protein ACFVRD_47320 [Streptomyces sp. NPDC057908]|uniref:hypothetical protein n=1 Tax=Streptomyces sp. NPDC057908 TaxID=3346276 RepID=UPI0036E11E79
MTNVSEHGDHTEAYMAEDRANMTEPARAFLDAWLSSMDTELDRWRTVFLPSGFPYDFTLGSLDALEHFPDQAAVAAEHNADFTSGAVRYIGEVAHRSVPSRWGYQDRGEDHPSPCNRVRVRGILPGPAR